MNLTISQDEMSLLEWLGQEDYSQYGECHGEALNSLVAKGFAKVHEGQEHQRGFIASGVGPMYRAVSLTDAGQKALTDSQ